MMRFPRIVYSITLICLLSSPASRLAAGADEAAPAAPSSAPVEANNTTAAGAETPQAAPALVDLVDTFWHYGKIARYDLAADAGGKILASGSEPRAILEAFESVAGRKGDNIDEWMLRWRSLPVPSDTGKAAVEKMRQVAQKVNDQINEGYATRRNDPEYIRQTILEMSSGSRAYDNNMPRLAKSGEAAVKVVIDILRNPAEVQYFATCRRILRDFGRKALDPLLAATEMKDTDTLVDVISALGDIGYDTAAPYLERLASATDMPPAIHTAARNALVHMGVANLDTIRPSDGFYSLAEKFYYHRSDIEPAGDKIAFVWFWTDQALQRTAVPTPIFDDLLAMRAAEYAMKLDSTNSAAVSLWLAANTKREVDLPPGQADLAHKGDPDANYYNVSAGVSYLDDALCALRDHNAAVAFKLCQSLQNIIGQGNLAGSASNPLTEALYFPNRQVRYEAAFALAQSLPTKAFPGSDRVVPLLVEAISQTDKPGVLVVAPASSTDTVNVAELRGAVKDLGYPVVSASNPTDGADAAISLPTVDLIIISEDSDVRKMVELERSIARLQGASMLVLTRSPSNPYVVQSATDSLMNTAVFPAKQILQAALKTAIDGARQHSGTAVLTPQEASAYALRAARLLEKLAITRGQALDVSVAEGGLLAALSDSRPEIAIAAGEVLGTLNSVSAQNGLAMKANEEATPAQVRVGLYKSLADSAKHQGNHLGNAEVAGLEKVVSGSKNADIRDAAAEARGALNLPAGQARTLIIKQSRV